MDNTVRETEPPAPRGHTIATEADTWAEGEATESVAPLEAVTHGLRVVAEGGAMSSMHSLATSLMPDDRGKAEEFMAAVKRLELASSGFRGMAQEAYFGKFK